MSMIDRFSFEADSPLRDLPFAVIQSEIRTRAIEHDLLIRRDDASEIQIETAYGTYRATQIAQEVRVHIGSTRADWLYVLKESLTDVITDLAPASGAAIQWSDAAETAGNLPPNFQFITIEDVTPAAGGFLRVTALAEDLSHFTPDSIHFRLALPDLELEYPEWPSLSATGQTVWPKGAATLHRPVYTVRTLDAAQARLSFDIFAHEGGRTFEWARCVSPGSSVGLTGPGGGGIPDGTSISLFSDETGFPAVARILEALPAEASGTVVLHSTNPASLHYAMPEHSGFQIRRFAPDAHIDLADHAIAALSANPDRTIWFAAEKSKAQRVRAHLKTEGLSAKHHYIAGYWSRSATPAETA